MLYISTKLCEIISNGIKVIERTRFLYRQFQRGIIPHKMYRINVHLQRGITKGNNFTKNVGGVRVVNLCKSSGHALYFYQVL